MTQKNKTIVLTGATSGIGKAAAITLAGAGAKVIATSRNPEKGQALLDECKAKYPSAEGSIELVECDFSSLASIVVACKKIKADHSTIDTLINNAGVWKMSYSESQDNIEETWQVNVLAPLLISHILLGNVLKSDDGRIIYTASTLHKGIIDLENPEMRGSFAGMKSYAQSKLANILMGRWLAGKFPEKQVGVYSFHPGLVRTDISRDAPKLMSFIMGMLGISPEKGARTLLHLATEPQSNLVSGEYYEKKKVKKATAESNDLDMAGAMIQVAEKHLGEYVKEGESVIFGEFL